MAKNKINLSGLVFSTNPDFKMPEDEQQDTTLPPQQQDLRIWLEKNHRGGKTASVIKNFVGNTTDLENLCRELKTKCGTGGSAKDGEIIIQGDHRKNSAKFYPKWDININSQELDARPRVYAYLNYNLIIRCTGIYPALYLCTFGARHRHIAIGHFGAGNYLVI
ncbi:MAG: translation initiation factor [Bacteroidetes bacterium]|nr:translation initiation factor [Bacteroidota bacterium]